MMCSVARGPRFLKWKMPRDSGPYALLFLQILILLVTWSLLNESASSRDIRFTSYAPDESSSMKSAYPA